MRRLELQGRITRKRGIMKKCRACNFRLSVSCFHKDISKPDGHQNKCKMCVKKYQSLPHVMEIKRKAQRKYSKTENGINTEKRHAPIRRKRSKAVGRQRAMHLVRRAVLGGEIEKLPCQKCGSICSQAHHEDYSRPIDVIWLCPLHHMERHSEIRKCNLKLVG